MSTSSASHSALDRWRFQVSGFKWSIADGNLKLETCNLKLPHSLGELSELDSTHPLAYTEARGFDRHMGILQPVDLGLIGYKECLALQRKLMDARVNGEIEDTLLLLEHKPVITLGTSGGEDNMLVNPEVIEHAGIEVFSTDRGGNITYHGPGQLVGYPIFDLRQHGKDVHLFLRNVEQAIVDCLADFGITAYATPGYAGVWVGDDKICSIGLAVRRWVSYHGFALNVNPCFDHWSLINPCGLVGTQMTSIEKLTGADPGMDAVKAGVIQHFARVFDLRPVVGE